MEYSLIRKQARENLTGNWGISIAVAAIASLLGALLIGSQFFPQLTTQTEGSGFRNLDLNNFHLRIGNYNVTGIIGFFLGGTVQLGYVQYLLKQYHREKGEFSDLFSQFHRFGQGFAQAFLRGLFTFLWSLLFFIPGIVKSLSYSMAPYIMADNPEMTALEAINASKEMMDGHKMDLFILHLTFIGWDMLAMLTLNLGHLVLNPYKNAAQTVFYRELCAARRSDYTASEF